MISILHCILDQKKKKMMKQKTHPNKNQHTWTNKRCYSRTEIIFFFSYDLFKWQNILPQDIKIPFIESEKEYFMAKLQSKL